MRGQVLDRRLRIWTAPKKEGSIQKRPAGSWKFLQMVKTASLGVDGMRTDNASRARAREETTGEFLMKPDDNDGVNWDAIEEAPEIFRDVEPVAAPVELRGRGWCGHSAPLPRGRVRRLRWARRSVWFEPEVAAPVELRGRGWCGSAPTAKRRASPPPV